MRITPHTKKILVAILTGSLLISTPAWSAKGGNGGGGGGKGGGGGGKNKGPAVELTSPSNGSSFVAPTDVEITANATSNNSTITQVEFFIDSVSIGVDSQAPYSVSWHVTTPGAYNITATATDASNVSTTSSTASITVTGPPPELIQAPQDNTVVYGGTVTVSGTYVGEPISTTIIADNGQDSKVAAINGNAYSVTLPVFKGANIMTVSVARRDRTFDRASITVFGGDLPTVQFVSPTENQFEAPANIDIEVQAYSVNSNISQVEFTANGTSLATLVAPPYEYTWQNVPSGNYTLRATATDDNGQARLITKNISVIAPNQPPTITLDSPLEGAIYSEPATIQLQATAADSDGTVAKVEFLNNGQVIGTDTFAPYSYSWSDVAQGSYVLSARVTDDRGESVDSNTATVTVTPPNSPPSVNLTSPVSGAIYTEPASITVSASAADSDGSIAKVAFYDGGALIGEVTSEPYSLTHSGVSAGNHVYSAIATDDLGATTTSASVSIVVDEPPPNNLPSVSLTSPTSGAEYEAPAMVSLAANASDSDGTITRVEFYANAALVGSAVTSPYTIVWSDVPTGNYSITAKAIDDKGGMTTSSSVAIIVNEPPPNAAPTIILIEPEVGQIFYTPGTVELLADASDSDGTVEKVEFYSGTELIASFTNQPYQFEWFNPPVGNHEIVAIATDDRGKSTQSSPVSIIVRALTINIIEPFTGAAISGNRVTVKGYLDGPTNTGVMVNGEVAAIADNGNEFYFNLPLSEGGHEIIATLTTQDGRQIEDTVMVTANAESSFLEVAMSQQEVVSGEKVKFTVKNKSPSTASVLFNQSSTFEVPANATVAFEATYNAGAVYINRFDASNLDGQNTSQEYVVVSHDRTLLTQKILGLWSSMNENLINQDINTALQFLSPSAIDIYEPVFLALMPEYEQILETFSPFSPGLVTIDNCDFVVRRMVDGQKRVFFIAYLRDKTGIWRLDSM